MTEAEWRTATDPQRMIRWLSHQGQTDALWDFTVACCRRIWDQLPGESFQRVVERAEQVGRGFARWEMVEDDLHEAYQALDRLERKLLKAKEGAEQDRLNRAIGYGRAVFAFEF